MKQIIIVTPTLNIEEGIGAYARIKNDLFINLGSQSRIFDISDDFEYNNLVELLDQHKGLDIIYVILEFEINILIRKRPLDQLISLFQNRNKNIHLSIMFHELWNKTEGIKPVRLVKNMVKRQIIRNFIKHVKPEKVFTNSNYNTMRLKNMGVHSSFNPIYSNIRITHFNKTKDGGIEWLLNRGLDIKDRSVNIGVIFGIIHKDWRYIQTLKLLKQQSFENKKSLILIYLGPYGERPIFQKLKTKLEPICPITNLGLLSEEDVCLAIASADFGFCTTPLALASRSGSLAALLEAELPVLVSDNEKLRNYNFETIGLPKNSFWDIQRLENEGFPIKEENNNEDKLNYRLEVAKKILEAL